MAPRTYKCPGLMFWGPLAREAPPCTHRWGCLSSAPSECPLLLLLVLGCWCAGLSCPYLLSIHPSGPPGGTRQTRGLSQGQPGPGVDFAWFTQSVRASGSTTGMGRTTPWGRGRLAGSVH